MRLGEPEKRLMVAVLQTVVDDCGGLGYRRGTGHEPHTNLRHTRQAKAYAASADRAWPFSFENLCDALDVDAPCLRRALRRKFSA